MKPKTFVLIAGALAAEQRPVVAHSASYGLVRPKNVQAPAGAKENLLPSLILSALIPRCSAAE